MSRVLKINIRKQDQSQDPGLTRVTPESVDEDRFLNQREFVGRLYPDAKVVFLEEGARVLGGYNGRGRTTQGEATYSVFYAALQEAFNNHYRFAIRPEVLWYLILHEVAQCVKLNPDQYRHLFSKHEEGRDTIEMMWHETRMPADWAPAVKMMATILQQRMPSSLGRFAHLTFTTSTPVTTAATAIAFMESASPYYDYRAILLCGIPEIRLDGEPSDYSKLVESTLALRALFSEDLGMYFDHLIPVLRKIAEQAAGAPIDHEFWGSIYNLSSGSGGSDGSDEMGGWITTFINYVRNIKGGRVSFEPGPERVEFEPKPMEAYDWTAGKRHLRLGQVPNHVSSAKFELVDSSGNSWPMRFIGGALRVDLDDDDFVIPQLSYGILAD